jgi:hypothetical protein
MREFMAAMARQVWQLLIGTKVGRWVLAAMIVLLLGFVGRIAFHYAWAETLEITVTQSAIKSTPGTGDQKYLVWATHDGESEVFEVSDSWLWLAFNSSDRYGRLQLGKTLRVKVAGVRFPFWSWYRNIVDVGDR